MIDEFEQSYLFGIATKQVVVLCISNFGPEKRIWEFVRVCMWCVCKGWGGGGVGASWDTLSWYCQWRSLTLTFKVILATFAEKS